MRMVIQFLRVWKKKEGKAQNEGMEHDKGIRDSILFFVVVGLAFANTQELRESRNMNGGLDCRYD